MAEESDWTVVMATDASGKEKWSDSSRLLFQLGYLKVLKEMAYSGDLQQYNIRGVCWRLFLGCLPEDQTQWASTTLAHRNKYEALRKKYVQDPHQIGASLDVMINNPLSQAENSPWNQFFLDNELRQLIDQDIVRTFPEVQFFKEQEIQDAMQAILFCYAKAHPDMGYRQGMHELLAPILFVLRAEMRDVKNDDSLAPALKVVMDPEYIEHDAFTIFLEVMESVEPWYMSTALEADMYRQRAATSQNKMAHDPRTQKPFQEKDFLAPTSAISRKLDMIHHVLLKKADETLYLHFKELAIPPQTYGIRWMRLLFGREFALPSVLELWDVLFADGPSLSLVDYMCVAMLMHIREVLIEGDYALCMQHLMRFPVVYEVNYLVQRALHLRNPSAFPSPRIWSYQQNAHPTNVGSHSPSNAPRNAPSNAPPPATQPAPTGNIQQPGGTFQSKANKAGVMAKQVLTKQIPKALTREFQKPRLEFRSPKRDDLSPSPLPPSHPHTITTGQESDGSAAGLHGNAASLHGNREPEPQKPKPRWKIVGDSSSRKQATPQSQEMTRNPRTLPPPPTASELEKLVSRNEDLITKCLYCGAKMDSILSLLQEEVRGLEGLTPDCENTLLCSLADLKHVRDLLLNKIPFSGEEASGWEVGPGRHGNSQDAKPTVAEGDEGGVVVSLEEGTDALEDSTQSQQVANVTSATPPLPIPATPTSDPLRGNHDNDAAEEEEEEGGNSVGSDWVDIAASPHPLTNENAS